MSVWRIKGASAGVGVTDKADMPYAVLDPAGRMWGAACVP